MKLTKLENKLENEKILSHRINWLVIFLIFFLPPAIMPEKNVEIISNDGYIISYSQDRDSTDCEIVITCNVRVDLGSITVSFYDDNDDFLETKESFFFESNQIVSCTFDNINGKVNSYEIISYDITSYSIMDYNIISSVLYFLSSIAFIFFILSLLLSAKKYDYNGNTIIVYAGWYHHYLKINGVKMDEHNTLISHTAIYLDCTLDDGTLIKATITLTNRISLKINNQLYINER